MRFKRPQPPGFLPDGGLAGRDEMISAMLMHQVYNSDTEDYLRCLEQDETHGQIDSATRKQLHNDAVETLRKSVDAFNIQVRIFKARESCRMTCGNATCH